MSEKKSLRIPVSNDDKVVNVSLTQEYDLLEILSLKFTQSDVYQSGLCSDYGVVCGRISANNGLGIPNAKVSIFIPLNSNDELDPVISSLYPYKEITDKNEKGYRYNLLPKRKQHGGHTPTGDFFDQEEILGSEEYLEIFENYYNYTVKTNESGDFMIWGVPVGKQTIHVDIDLSDIGCFSLRPYDFIRKGVGAEKFDRYFNFKSSNDIDGLPQIVKFEKTIEVYPFIGNEELCEIGISRVDFDLTELDIKIEPVAIVLVSSFTDDDSKAIKKNGKIKSKMGYKCNLLTSDGTIETVRFTGNNVYGSNGELYPELEYYPINEGINENGAGMVVLPMNLDYTYTNEFGEQVITSDKNKGIPTKNISRFRIGLNNNSQKYSSAKYLVPNIREFNFNKDGYYKRGEYKQEKLLTYMFSDVFEDYLKISNSYSGYTGLINNVPSFISNHKKQLILNVDETTNELKPLDYFYKFTYGKVYTISSFQGSYYDYETKKNDSFLGIKEIRPDEESDCAGTTNYIPTNYAFRNKTKFSTFISELLLLLTYLLNLIIINIGEFIGKFIYDLSDAFWNIYIPKPINWRPFENLSKTLKKTAYKIQSYFTVELSLKTYPDCDECLPQNSDIFPTEKKYCNKSEFNFKIGYSDTHLICYLPSGETLNSDVYRYLRSDKSFYYIEDDVNCETSVTELTEALFAPNVYSKINDGTIERFYCRVLPGILNTKILFTPFEISFINQDPWARYRNDISTMNIRTGTTNTLNPQPVKYNVGIHLTKFKELTGVDLLLGDNEYYKFDGSTERIVIKIYDRNEEIIIDNGGGTNTDIEQGCDKYDTLYDDDLFYKYVCVMGNTTYDINGDLDVVESEFKSFINPPTGYNILSTISAEDNTEELPLTFDGDSLGRKTISGKSEIRDGVFTVIPVINGDSNNYKLMLEWYKRKRIGLLFCSGIINYSFIDNWLHGVLYFFKFRKRILWDNEEINNLNQRGSKFPRELVFYNVLDGNFYYRSTPYDPLTKQFKGMLDTETNNKLILHPTTFYDVGVRDEFFYEICSDPTLDPTCSVIRDITSTSYQDPANIVEYGLMYRGDISKKTNVESFFNTNDFDGNAETFDGDFIQLFSINSEAGIEAFDLDTPHYFMYNNEKLDPELEHKPYFTSGTTNYGPLPIDFKFDSNGKFIRSCLNYRLGDFNQNVPFYLWNKQGEGFGPYGTNSDTQKWDKSIIANMPLQRIYSINNATTTNTNYVMNDGEEEYLLRPMNITHDTIMINGYYDDIIERFDYISTNVPDNLNTNGASAFTENEIWLKVTSGTITDPINGDIYVVINKTWIKQNVEYINGSQEIFLFQTKQNYSGTKQVLSTPFMFYFGLKPQNTSLDLLNKYYGAKGSFTMTD